jgi:P27 family predicted phage terminase small subunit
LKNFDAFKFRRRSPAPRAPTSLSIEAKKLWRRIQEGYDITDEAGLLLLQTAFEAFDRMREAQNLIKTEGMTTRDRFGQAKSHPAATIERDSRAGMLAALRALNLDIEHRGTLALDVHPAGNRRW